MKQQELFASVQNFCSLLVRVFTSNWCEVLKSALSTRSSRVQPQLVLDIEVPWPSAISRLFTTLSVLLSWWSGGFVQLRWRSGGSHWNLYIWSTEDIDSLGSQSLHCCIAHLYSWHHIHTAKWTVIIALRVENSVVIGESSSRTKYTAESTSLHTFLQPLCEQGKEE